MNTISRHLVPTSRRVSVTAQLFGHRFATRVEPFVYNVASRMSRDYRGGYWAFYTLSNGGFYMAPDEDYPFHLVCENYFEGDLSADALGITVCLYAYSHLSFLAPPEFADVCAERYSRLREYMLEHPEVNAIAGGSTESPGDPTPRRRRMLLQPLAAHWLATGRRVRRVGSATFLPARGVPKN